MKRCATNLGFSLIEVVLAVGIFALTVPTTVALLGALGRQGTISAETRVAQRLSGGVRVELARLAQAGFENFAVAVPVMSSPPSPGFALVADRDGFRLHSRDYLPPGVGIAPAGQYFLIECWRFEDEPLRFESDKAFLALFVRVSWPYYLSNGTIANVETRSAISFTVVLNR